MTNADRLLAAGAAAALIVAVVATWSLIGDGAPAGAPAASEITAGLEEATPQPTQQAELVVDVEGAVRQPGVHRLAAGARLADAVSAAGGFAPDADLAAVSLELNLAAPLVDGQHIYVPREGDSAIPGGSDAGADGLVNLNTAGSEALEALPGIGPVTTQKILTARQERPFATLEELVERGVMNRGQLEQIRELVTVR